MSWTRQSSTPSWPWFMYRPSRSETLMSPASEAYSTMYFLMYSPL
jgi:hypothetical protein